MSSGMIAYEIANGTLVQVQLSDTVFRGEFNIQLGSNQQQGGGCRNPVIDRVVLEQPLELPLGKKHTGTVSFPVADIIRIDLIEVGLFKKRSPEYEEEMMPSLPMSIMSGVTGISSYTLAQAMRGGQPGQPTKKKIKGKLPKEVKDLEPVEIQLKTYVIKDPMQLKILLKLMKEIDVCGLSLEGARVGREGIVTWVILTAGKTLIPLDIDSLYERIPDMWKSLEKNIFANEKLIKIMHDGRAAADYLWHVHGIRMVNIFDTQVADALVAKDHMGYAPPQLSPLSDCLQMYNRRIPPEELDYLRRYEGDDPSQQAKSPLLNKPLPPPEYLKLCAIKVKHLVPLRENLLVRLMDKYSACVEAHISSFRDRPVHEYLAAAKKPREVPKELLDILEEELGQLVV